MSKNHYLALRRQNVIPRAIPSMCVLVVKPDKDGRPHRAKSCIVVLRNLEDAVYNKSQRYAPVLKQTSLRLLVPEAVRNQRILQQGDCNNAFCQATLPDDERIAVRSPTGDPARNKDELWLLNKTLYGLRRSPKHWYNKFTKILRKMGLSPSLHDPCVYRGVCVDTEDPGATEDRAEVHVGIYVDDFVFCSTDPAQEALFGREMESKCKVDFLGDIDYFLGTSFT